MRLKNQTPHYVAMKRLNLRKGDKVKLIAAARTLERGWENSWVPDMDSYVGQVGTAVGRGSDTGIPVVFSEGESACFFYPAFYLEKIKE